MNKTYQSNCQGETIRGKAHQLVASYEAKAYEAQRAGDEYLANIYFQHAEHYKRLQE